MLLSLPAIPLTRWHLCRFCISLFVIVVLMETLTFRLWLQGVSWYQFLWKAASESVSVEWSVITIKPQKSVWFEIFEFVIKDPFEWPKCWHMCVKRRLFKVLMFCESDLNFVFCPTRNQGDQIDEMIEKRAANWLVWLTTWLFDWTLNADGYLKVGWMVWAINFHGMC